MGNFPVKLSQIVFTYNFLNLRNGNMQSPHVAEGVFRNGMESRRAGAE